jgi:hypothetical protein
MTNDGTSINNQELSNGIFLGGGFNVRATTWLVSPIVLVFLFSYFPLLLSASLVIVCHKISPHAAGNTLILTILVATAQFVLAGKRGAKSFVGGVLGVSSFGSLGMAIGALMEHGQRLSCCISVFDFETLFAWPTLLMFLFCIASSRAFGDRCIRIDHVRVCRGWASLPAMYIGMCLAGRYLSAPMTPVFGVVLATHWAMFVGMAAGHMLECLIVKAFTLFRHLISVASAVRQLNSRQTCSSIFSPSKGAGQT